MRSYEAVVVYAMTELGRDLFVPPDCHRCGAQLGDPAEWFEVSAAGESQPRYIPGHMPCPTPRCGEVCKICRREVGDVHGPHCGALMATKVERPHIVDRSDCQ